MTAGTDDEENAELRDMTKRFWIGAALKLLDNRRTAAAVARQLGLAAR